MKAMNKTIVSAEIITIGTELLLGDITDINTPFILKELKKLGIDVFRTITVGDNLKRISRQISQSLKNADIVITTGGLGPTVDDPTREAVADVYGVQLTFQDDLWEQIKQRFGRFNHTPTENNQKQAYLPEGATAITNSVGTAPAFFYYHNGRILISLPGVPKEVEHIFIQEVVPILNQMFDTGLTTVTKVIRTAGAGESTIDSKIGEYEKLKNPTVGVTAHPGQVDVRITAKASDYERASAMIAKVKDELVEILSEHIFGFDDDTLESSLNQLINKEKLKITLYYPASKAIIFENIFNNQLIFPSEKIDYHHLSKIKTGGSLYNTLKSKDVLVLFDYDEKHPMKFELTMIHKTKKQSKELFFGGHTDLFPEWAGKQILNTILKFIKLQVKE